ncbi:nucleolar protein Dnt1 [Schizosaccharomyces japonicus yFS275]|uniref:Nucleolar protein Dnt1 n=1 Tax=Schizosaccharomyces japonicus (strain yFS275 / FY16936) TaxID=402676 RepID=B6JWV8_SCHJY|nr:nucleolar protein Dnt1 [Schizosaccharomyces japonicus yFS275]EEB05859.1 nucleolar protein Dnt1 [Schizosaccharomyces japonicus yFS275]
MNYKLYVSRHNCESRRFLHISRAGCKISELKSAIEESYKNLYPFDSDIDILNIKDDQGYDIPGEYKVDQVFTDGSKISFEVIDGTRSLPSIQLSQTLEQNGSPTVIDSHDDLKVLKSPVVSSLEEPTEERQVSPAKRPFSPAYAGVAPSHKRLNVGTGRRDERELAPESVIGIRTPTSFRNENSIIDATQYSAATPPSAQYPGFVDLRQQPTQPTPTRNSHAAETEKEQLLYENDEPNFDSDSSTHTTSVDRKNAVSSKTTSNSSPRKPLTQRVDSSPEPESTAEKPHLPEASSQEEHSKATNEEADSDSSSDDDSDLAPLSSRSNKPAIAITKTGLQSLPVSSLSEEESSDTDGEMLSDSSEVSITSNLDYASLASDSESSSDESDVAPLQSLSQRNKQQLSQEPVDDILTQRATEQQTTTATTTSATSEASKLSPEPPLTQVPVEAASQPSPLKPKRTRSQRQSLSSVHSYSRLSELSKTFSPEIRDPNHAPNPNTRKPFSAIAQSASEAESSSQSDNESSSEDSSSDDSNSSDEEDSAAKKTKNKAANNDFNPIPVEKRASAIPVRRKLRRRRKSGLASLASLV